MRQDGVAVRAGGSEVVVTLVMVLMVLMVLMVVGGEVCGDRGGALPSGVMVVCGVAQYGVAEAKVLLQSGPVVEIVDLRMDAWELLGPVAETLRRALCPATRFTSSAASSSSLPGPRRSPWPSHQPLFFSLEDPPALIDKGCPELLPPSQSIATRQKVAVDF